MEIVIIGTAYPFRGGIAAFNERMARELVKEGHSVSIYTFTIQYPSLLFPGKTQYSEEPQPNDLVIQRKVNTINPLNWFKIGKELRKLAPDLILVKYWIPFIAPSLGTILRSVRKNGKTKTIAVLDNIIPHERRIGDKVLTKYFVKAIDAFVAMSKTVEKDLELFTTTKPKAFNPHPVFDNFGEKVSREEAAQFLKLDVQEKYILFFGIIRDYKGLDWLLEAYAQSKMRGKAKLLVVGEYYNNPEQYQELIQKLGIEEDVLHFNHFINDSEVKYFFSLADLLVQPYKHATQSGVTQIAYNFDLPMVVTEVGGLPEMIPHQRIGLVVPPHIDSIQKAMDSYFSEELEEQFRNNFKEEKQKYAWSELNKTIYGLLKSLQK